MSSTKNTAKLSAICNIIAWGLLTLSDWFDETTRNSSIYAMIMFVMGTLFIVYVVYMVKKKKDATWKEKLIDKAIWFGISLAFSVVIVFLVDENTWIVHQATGGWENFLNGIEYILLGAGITVCDTAAFLLFDLLCWLYQKAMKSRNLAE